MKTQTRYTSHWVLLKSFLGFLLLWSQLSLAALPPTLNYQGHLTDSGGAPVNASLSITFNLYNVSAGGIAVWSESQTVTVNQGIFSVELGANGSPLSATMFETPLWVGLSVATDAEMIPRRAVTTTGYSFKAGDADSVEGISAAALDQSNHVSDIANPHSVTPVQIGAADLINVQAHINDFKAHDGNTNNPHSVTAKQTGAARIVDLTEHTLTSAAHHAPYTNTNAVAAMGATDDRNTLNHNKRSDAQVMSAVTSLDGAGSTLDADLVDGLQASEIIDAAQDEVRTPISSLPYTISSSGSYYLTGDLYDTGGFGINVNEDNVTIDLMGFMLSGNGGTADSGIKMVGRTNVEIRNGTVRNFGASGISDADTAARGHRIINVRVMGNGNVTTSGKGIELYGANHRVQDCTVAGNFGRGFFVSSNSVLTDNVVYENGRDGIFSGNGSIVSNNIVHSNLNSGIVDSYGSIISNNTIHNNQDNGIEGGSRTTIKDNQIYENNLAGNSSQGGIYVHTGSQVLGNHLHGNLQNNIYVYSSSNVIEDNLVKQSTFGINFRLGFANFYAGNRADSNTTDYNAAGQTDGGGNFSF